MARIRGRLQNLPHPSALARFIRSLRGPRRLSVLRAVVDAIVVTITLRRRGVRPLIPASVGNHGSPNPDFAAEVADAVDDAFAVLPIAPTCLRRSITLMRELRRLQITATMHIGVRTVADRVEAHAWVQAGERVVNDDPDEISTYAQIVGGDVDRFLPSLR